jgi:peptidyl-prolyl cis-trans isomerase C
MLLRGQAGLWTLVLALTGSVVVAQEPGLPPTAQGRWVLARHIFLRVADHDPQAVQKTKAKMLALRKEIEDRVSQELARTALAVDAQAREKERRRVLEKVFAETAAKVSGCVSKRQGGNVGWFPREGVMVESFARAAFSLKRYQMSAPVVTEFGVHLIMVVDIKEGKVVQQTVD